MSVDGGNLNLGRRPAVAAVRYYFDLRDWDGLIVDDEGVKLRTLDAVQKEATDSMTDALRECLRWPIRPGQISVEVRDNEGQVMCVRFSIEIEIGRKN
jgi:hypothetical protein